MNFKTTYLLFGILAAELAGLGLLLALGGRSGDLGYVFPSWHDPKTPLDPAALNTVEIERPGKKRLVFVRQGQAWFLQKPRIRLENYRLLSLVRQLTQARREEEADVTANKRAWGLEPPHMVVTLKQGGSQAWSLNIGKESPEKNGVVYVTSSDRPDEVMAVRKAELANVVPFHFEDYWYRKILEANPFTTLVLTIADTSKGRDSSITLTRNTGGSYDFTAPPFGPADMEPDLPRKSPGVRGLLGAIDKMQAAALEPFDAHPLDWYGLQDGAPGLRITVENTPPAAMGRAEPGIPVADTLLIGNKVEQKGEYYTRLVSEPVVYRIDGAALETVREVMSDGGQRLRSRKLIEVPPLLADALTIKNAKGTIELRRGGGQTWLLRSAATGVQQGDGLKIHQLLVALDAAQQVRQFLDTATDAGIGLKESSPSLAVWKAGLETTPPPPGMFPALKKDVADKPTARVWFGMARGDLVQVKREEQGFINRLAVPVDLRRQTEKGPLEYLDRNLAPFLTKQVEKLILKRKGETLEFTAANNHTKWLLQGKAADPTRVEIMLAALTRLRAAQWVQAKPNVADLKKYQLDNSPLQVEVTFRTQEGNAFQKRTFSFGKGEKLADGRKGIYGRMTGTNLGFETDLVFLVPAEAIAGLEKGP